MVIPYYSPNFFFKELLFSLFQLNAKEKTIDFFRELSGKKYILLTASCRSALYLTYKSLETRGGIITSPLTCKTAIDPIFWSGNHPLFADIDKNTLNHLESEIINLISKKPIAIQVINHGGIPFDTKSLKQKTKGTCLIVEDCAQSFGAKINGVPSGYFADVACYSLIKTAYGIGGGILATNDLTLFEKAKSLQDSFPPFSLITTFYRLVKNTLESYRSYYFAAFLYKRLIAVKQNIDTNKLRYLKKPHILFFNVFIQQSRKFESLHKKRRLVAELYIKKLNNKHLISNCNTTNYSTASFTKFFIFNQNSDSHNSISYLNRNGIEARHLEQKADASVQPILSKVYFDKNIVSLNDCKNYTSINHKIVSLPLFEFMNEKQLDFVIEKYKESINE